MRALKRRVSPGVALVGIDHSQALVERARKETADEGLTYNVEYATGDAHDIPYAESEFDVVTMHTLISHVEDPGRVLAEARRVLRPGGTVAVFDGDYASLTFAHPDPVTAVTVEEKLKQVMVANPRVMRDLPRLFQEARLDLVAAEGVGVRRHRQRQLLGERGRGVRRAAGPVRAVARGGGGGLAGRSGGRPRPTGRSSAPRPTTRTWRAGRPSSTSSSSYDHRALGQVRAAHRRSSSNPSPLFGSERALSRSRQCRLRIGRSGQLRPRCCISLDEPTSRSCKGYNAQVAVTTHQLIVAVQARGSHPTTEDASPR